MKRDKTLMDPRPVEQFIPTIIQGEERVFSSPSTDEEERASSLSSTSTNEAICNPYQKKEEALAKNIALLDDSIKHYNTLYKIKEQIKRTFIGFISTQGAKGIALSSSQLLSQASSFTHNTKNVTHLLTSSLFLASFGNALGLGIQLFLSCKAWMIWKRAGKLEEKLQKNTPFYVLQKEVEAEEEKKKLVQTITSLLFSHTKKCSFFFSKEPKLSTYLKEMEKNLQLQEEAKNKETFSNSIEQIEQNLKMQESVSSLLLTHLIENTSQWEQFLQNAQKQGDEELQATLSAILKQKARYQELTKEANELSGQASKPLYMISLSKKEIESTPVQKIQKILHKIFGSKKGREALQNVEGLPAFASNDEKIWKEFLSKYEKTLRNVTEKVEDSYVRRIVPALHSYMDQFVANKSMLDALQKQKQKEEEAIEFLQAKIELILQAHKISATLEKQVSIEEKLNKLQQIHKLMPTVKIPLQEVTSEDSLGRFYHQLFIHYKMPFPLSDLKKEQLSTGHNLKVDQQRLGYLASTFHIPSYQSQGDWDALYDAYSDTKKARAEITVLKSARKKILNNEANTEEIALFSRHQAENAFRYQTALSKSLKNGLQALAQQKISYAKDLEGGGTITKTANLLARGIYLFSSIATCLCFPLMATGVFTIPAIALLIFSWSLSSIVSLSLVGGALYWKTHSRHLFKQAPKNAWQNMKNIVFWLRDQYRKLKGKDSLYVSENALIFKKKELLLQQKRVLVLEAELVALHKNALNIPSIASPSTEMLFSRLFSDSSNTWKEKIERKIQQVENAYIELESVQESLSHLEALYKKQNDEGISSLEEARIRDMAEPKKAGSLLSKYHIEPIKLAFPSLFQSTERNLSTTARSLEAVLTDLLTEEALPTDLELLFEAIGISLDSIKVQVAIEKEKEHLSLNTSDFKEKVQTQVEQALGQFFGASLEKITHTEHLGFDAFTKVWKE